MTTKTTTTVIETVSGSTYTMQCTDKALMTLGQYMVSGSGLFIADFEDGHRRIIAVNKIVSVTHEYTDMSEGSK